MLEKIKARLEALEQRVGIGNRGPAKVSFRWVDAAGRDLPGQPSAKLGTIILNFD